MYVIKQERQPQLVGEYGQNSSFLASGPFFRNMDLRATFRLLKLHLPIIIGMTLAGGIFALVFALVLTPQYRATTVVLLDPRQTHVLGGEVVSGLPIDNSAIRSEIDIITSDAVVSRVVEKMKLKDDTELQPKNFLGFLKEWDPRKQPENDADPEDLKLAQIKKAIEKRLTVENDGRSFSIMISYRSQNPTRAMQIANAFADEYLVDQLEAKYEATARASKWLDTRISSLKEQLVKSENAVQDFRKKTNLIEIEGTTVSARQMDVTNTQLIEARAQTSQAQARLKAAQSMLKSDGDINSATDVLSSPLIQKLREQEAEVRRQETEMATKYGELHPKMINMKAQYRDLQAKISEEAKKIIRGLSNEVDIARAKQNQLEKSLGEQEKRANVEMSDSVQLRQLQREADANRTMYEDFLNRFKQTSAQEQLQTPDSRIIARAYPPAQPSFPIVWLFIMAGIILGGFTGIALAYLIEYLDRGFRNAAQAEEGIGIPVIGLVPSLEGSTDLSPSNYVLEKPLSAYAESLRTVRAAINFSNVDHPPKIVSVTSSVPGEGKTTLCVSLARTLAKAGNKVLLVDADMRRPNVAKTCGLQDVRAGLSAILTGELSLDAVKLPDPKISGLDIIPALDKVANSQDLLGSLQMSRLLKEVAQDYDLILVDTPPVLALSDAAIVARHADTTLFLVRWATTPRDTTIEAVKKFGTFGYKMAGLVLTQVDMAKQAKYGESYSYHNYKNYYAN